MPWINLLGWGVTGLLLFIVLSKLTPAPRAEVRFLISVYMINFALPLGFCVLNQYWSAVLADLGSVAVAFFVFGKKETIWQSLRLQSFPRPAESANYRHDEIDSTLAI